MTKQQDMIAKKTDEIAYARILEKYPFQKQINIMLGIDKTGQEQMIKDIQEIMDWSDIVKANGADEMKVADAITELKKYL